VKGAAIVNASGVEGLPVSSQRLHLLDTLVQLCYIEGECVKKVTMSRWKTDQPTVLRMKEMAIFCVSIASNFASAHFPDGVKTASSLLDAV
jgi:hypothetical protein